MSTEYYWQEPACCATCKYLVYSTKYNGHACAQHQCFIPNPHRKPCEYYTPKHTNNNEKENN